MYNLAFMWKKSKKSSSFSELSFYNYVSLDDLITEPDTTICNSALLACVQFLCFSSGPQWEILGSRVDEIGHSCKDWISLLNSVIGLCLRRKKKELGLHKTECVREEWLHIFPLLLQRMYSSDRKATDIGGKGIYIYWGAGGLSWTLAGN